jgi:tetratricopeptide (TPR) repeat protein
MKHKRLFLACTLPALLTLASCSHKPSTPEEYCKAAAEYSKKQQKDKAIDLLGKCIKAFPDSPSCYLQLAATYHETGRSDIAIQHAGKVIEILERPGDIKDKDNVTMLAYVLRAGLHVTQGRHDLALADYEKRRKLFPDSPKAVYDVAGVLIMMKRYEAALDALNNLVKMAPNYPDAYYMRGGTYEALGELDLALSDLDKAISLGANIASVYQTRGRIHKELGNIELARADLSRADLARARDTAGAKSGK